MLWQFMQSTDYSSMAARSPITTPWKASVTENENARAWHRQRLARLWFNSDKIWETPTWVEFREDECECVMFFQPFDTVTSCEDLVKLRWWDEFYYLFLRGGICTWLTCSTQFI